MYTEKFTSPASYEFFFHQPRPQTFIQGDALCDTEVSLTALQKQKRKCNEIKLLLHLEIQPELSKIIFLESLFIHKNKIKIFFREALPL